MPVEPVCCKNSSVLLVICWLTKEAGSSIVCEDSANRYGVLDGAIRLTGTRSPIDMKFLAILSASASVANA